MTNRHLGAAIEQPLTIASVVLIVLALLTSPQPVSAQVAPPEVLACAPRLASATSGTSGLIVGAPDVPLRQLFGPGDTVIVNVGRADGVSVGTQFFTRRVEAPVSPAMASRGFHNLQTSGWLRAVAVEERSSLAVLERICSEVRRGDLLAPFQWPTPVSPSSAGTADYGDPATVLFAGNGRSMSGPGQFLVIDQGENREIQPGQRVTIFRAANTPEGPVTEIGQAVAVLVQATAATVQLIEIREPVLNGDLVAAHR